MKPKNPYYYNLPHIAIGGKWPKINPNFVFPTEKLTEL